jgi:hypothetical protein
VTKYLAFAKAMLASGKDSNLLILIKEQLWP